MGKINKIWRGGAAAAGAITIAMLTGSAAFAGSVSSTDTYAGDVNSIGLPSGTVIVLDYVGYQHADAFVDSKGESSKANANIYSNIARIAYFTELWNRPLVLEAAVPYARATGVNIPAEGGRVSTESGFFSPVLFASLGLIVDKTQERYLAFTNYLYLPVQRYDSSKLVNVGTPGQTVDVPQVTYAEGLGKFTPALKNFWLDVIANVSLHSDASTDPLSQNPNSILGLPFVGTAAYHDLTQDTSYNLKAFLRYNWNPLMYLAVGIEKSWGGEQTLTNGRVTGTALGFIPVNQALPNLSIGKDDYLKGHLQFGMPLSKDFQVTADVTHDFDRVGGLKEDIGVEVRLTKFFIPEVESLK